jgi:Ca2+-binding RTX toxin-like protein
MPALALPIAAIADAFWPRFLVWGKRRGEEGIPTMSKAPHRLSDTRLDDVVGGSGVTKTLVEDPDKLDKLPDQSPVEGIQGSAYGDIIGGKDGTQHVFGNGGDDLIFAGAGHDVIDAGAGNDTVYWRQGDGGDQIRGGDGQDTLGLVLDQQMLDLFAQHGGLQALANLIMLAPGSAAPTVGDGFIDLTGVTGVITLGNGQGVSFTGFERLVLTRG